MKSLGLVLVHLDVALRDLALVYALQNRNPSTPLFPRDAPKWSEDYRLRVHIEALVEPMTRQVELATHDIFDILNGLQCPADVVEVLLLDCSHRGVCEPVSLTGDLHGTTIVSSSTTSTSARARTAMMSLFML